MHWDASAKQCTKGILSKGGDRSRRFGNYRADMKKPRRREIIRGFITFSGPGFRTATGEAPGSASKTSSVATGSIEGSELQILWHGCHS